MLHPAKKHLVLSLFKREGKEHVRHAQLDAMGRIHNVEQFPLTEKLSRNGNNR